MGIGPIFFYILAFPIYILIHKLSQRLCADEWMLEGFNKSKQHKITVLNFLFGACFELNITACISIAKMETEDFKSFWEAVSMLLALFTLTVLAATPFFVFRASKRYNENLDDEDPYKKLFQDKNEKNLMALNYQSFYLVRRFIISASLVFLWEPVYQLI